MLSFTRRRFNDWQSGRVVRTARSRLLRTPANTTAWISPLNCRSETSCYVTIGAEWPARDATFRGSPERSVALCDTLTMRPNPSTVPGAAGGSSKIAIISSWPAFAKVQPSAHESAYDRLPSHFRSNETDAHSLGTPTEKQATRWEAHAAVMHRRRHGGLVKERPIF
jgi:hypothetical protein